MKAIFYWRYVTRAVWRGGQRTILAVLCVAIGVMAIVALQLVGNMVSDSLTGNVRDLNGGDLKVTDVSLTANRLQFFSQLQAQGTITAYTAVSSNLGSAQSPHPIARFDILMVDPGGAPLASTPIFEEPRHGQLSEILNATTIVLTHSLAQQMDAHVGDSFTVTLADTHAATLTVGGIVANGGQFQQPLAVMAFDTRAAFHETNDQPLFYTTVYADVPGHSASGVNSLANQIQGQVGDATIVTANDLLQNNRQVVNGIQSFLRIIGLVALLIGGMGIVNTMQVLLRRRRLEIAMLKAGGYTSRDLVALFGLEAGLLGLIGGALGAAAGIGVSFVIQGSVERALALTLPASIDPKIVASGVAVGLVTALIFGLLPIAEASQIRPIAVLRELPEGTRLMSRASVILLGLVVVALFYLLALAILHDPLLAMAVISGAAVVFGALYLLFSLVVGIMSRLALPGFIPGKATITLALRNLGRQRGGTVATQIALFVGVFAVGLILVLGQGLQAQYAQGGNDVNAIIWTPNLSAVQQQLQQTPSVTRMDVYRATGFSPMTINGNDITSEVANHQYDRDGLALLNGILGFDLAHGHIPAAPDFTLVAGRMLNAGDAGTDNVVVDMATQSAPLALKLGDQITVQYFSKNAARGGETPSGNPNVTVTIVGFYQNNTGVSSLQLPLLADYAAIDAVGGDNATYELGVHINPRNADAVLTQLQTSLPGQVSFHSYVESLAGIENYLSNLLLVLEAIVLPALLAGIINIANAVALAMLDRRREIGILKAVGHTSRRVLATIALEQGMAALTASLLAMVCAVGLSLFLVASLGSGTSGAVTGVTGKAGPAGTDGPSPSGASLPIAIPMTTVVAVLVGCAVLGIVVSAIVAWGATHRRPLEALRYE
jgi:ABC-type antimicrobial peptide transport system permease subunit